MKLPMLIAGLRAADPHCPRYEIGIFVDDEFRPIQNFRIEEGRIILLTEPYQFVRLLKGKSGRIAVFARIRPDHEWVQIESIHGMASAQAFAEDIEYNDEARAEFVESNLGESWGDDAPAAPPRK